MAKERAYTKATQEQTIAIYDKLKEVIRPVPNKPGCVRWIPGWNYERVADKTGAPPSSVIRILREVMKLRMTTKPSKETVAARQATRAKTIEARKQLNGAEDRRKDNTQYIHLRNRVRSLEKRLEQVEARLPAGAPWTIPLSDADATSE